MLIIHQPAWCWIHIHPLWGTIARQEEHVYSLQVSSKGCDFMGCIRLLSFERICTNLSSDTRCRTELVSFDRSHRWMFDAPKTDKGEIAYVGGVVESIKCKIVDKSLPVANNNGHPSTSHQRNCPGDACPDGKWGYLDCFTEAYPELTCNSGICRPKWNHKRDRNWKRWISACGNDACFIILLYLSFSSVTAWLVQLVS